MSRSRKSDSRALLSLLIAYDWGNAYRVLLYGTNNFIKSQDVRSVEGSDTLQNWDCKNSFIKIDLSHQTVIFDNGTQNGDPAADIGVHKFNRPVSTSTRTNQTGSGFETGSDSERVT